MHSDAFSKLWACISMELESDVAGTSVRKGEDWCYVNNCLEGSRHRFGILSASLSPSSVTLPLVPKGWDMAWGECPEGPADIASLNDNWVMDLSRRLEECFPGAPDNLRAALAIIDLTTSYSGVGTAELALHKIVVDMRVAGFQAWAATDISPVCKRVLCVDSPLSPGCVFSNIAQRVPRLILARLESLLGHYVAAYQRRLRLLSAGRRTPTRVKRLKGFYGNAFLRSAINVLQNVDFPSDTRVYCFKHGRRCFCYPQNRHGRLWVEVAGTTCVAFSSMSSSSMGWLHPSSIPCLIWCFMVRSRRPDVVIHENVVSFDVAVLRRILGDGWAADTLAFCPSSMGIPGTRRRRYTRIAPVERRRNPQYNLQNFARVAFRCMVCDARIYFNASVDEQRQYLSDAVSPGDVEEAANHSWSCMTSLGEFQRLVGWVKAASCKAHGSPEFGVINIAQNVEYYGASQVRSTAPALLRSSRLWAGSADCAWRPVLPLELLEIMAARGCAALGEYPLAQAFKAFIE